MHMNKRDLKDGLQQSLRVMFLKTRTIGNKYVSSCLLTSFSNNATVNSNNFIRKKIQKKSKSTILTKFQIRACLLSLCSTLLIHSAYTVFCLPFNFSQYIITHSVNIPPHFPFFTLDYFLSICSFSHPLLPTASPQPS